MKYIFFITLSLVLSGCAHQTLTPVIHDSQNYQQKLSQLKYWQLEGKIGVRHANKSDSAAVHWQQDENHFDIFLSGPLGAGATRLMGSPEKLLIQSGKEQSTTTSDPQQLIENHLGWTLPLEKLPLWILGCSDSNNAHPIHEQFNVDHTLASFEQDGWQVEYKTYQIVDQLLLPERIVLMHEDMQVIIVIKHWDINHQELN